jgi:hypothetical protein
MWGYLGELLHCLVDLVGWKVTLASPASQPAAVALSQVVSQMGTEEQRTEASAAGRTGGGGGEAKKSGQCNIMHIIDYWG